MAYTLHTYDLTEEEFSATAVADQLGLPAAQAFKTLAAQGDRHGFCLAVVPADAELDLKALARASDNRKMTMVSVAELEKLTGYRRGAVTALGTRRPLPVYVDDSALSHSEIAVSAGARGAQVMLATADYLAVTGAQPAPLRRDA